MSVEKNKAIARRSLAEFWNEGNTAVADELYAASYVNHDPVLPGVKSLEDLKGWSINLRGMYPDLCCIEKDIIAEEDKVVMRWVFSGTVSDQFEAESARGKKAEADGIIIFRIADGKIQEAWWNYDQLGVNKQLGLDLP